MRNSPWGRRSPCAALLVLLAMASRPAPASALGATATSAADTLDSKAPALTLLHPVGDEDLVFADVETLRFGIDEQSWAAGRPVRLRVLDGLTVLLDDSLPAEPSGAYAYPWPVPDHDTPFAVMVVAAADRYGWAAADTSAAFTIHGGLSGAPDAPGLRDVLRPGQPNPFNGGTELAFSLRAPARVALAIYDLRGREVARLADGQLPAGTHHVRWLGQDAAGRPAASGTYVARLAIRGEGRSSTQITRLTLVK